MQQSQEAAPLLDISLAELKQKGAIRVARGNSEALAVYLHDQVRVYDAVCPHLGGPLTPEMISAGVVTCPWHAYRWDLATGRCLTSPARSWQPNEAANGPVFSKTLVALEFHVKNDRVYIAARSR